MVMLAFRINIYYENAKFTTPDKGQGHLNSETTYDIAVMNYFGRPIMAHLVGPLIFRSVIFTSL